MRAVDYFQKKREYIPVIQKAYEELAQEYDIIVIEGAGSPAEINLKQDDIVNMGMARIADAPVLLVGDIDRGGVFAQLIGTVMLLEPEEQERIQGLIINKFRGDKTILEPGLAMLTERCGKEVLGVVPYADIDIEEEDSLAERLTQKKLGGGIDLAVIRLPRISNFTDLQAFALEQDVTVRYVEKASDLKRPDVIVLPGTKSTIQDMKWLRESGLETAIVRSAAAGCVVFGICGGYQMLGETITDCCHAEDGGAIRGMGLLSMDTYFEKEKTRTRVDTVTGQLGGGFEKLSGKKVQGYEIHMGHSDLKKGVQPFLLEGMSGKEKGGYCENVFGTYLHGIFDEKEFRRAFVQLLCERKGIAYGTEHTITYQQYKEQEFDKLAQLLRESLDMDAIYRIMGIERQ
jgi:adenosylcobyric acid synthase